MGTPGMRSTKKMTKYEPLKEKKIGSKSSSPSIPKTTTTKYVVVAMGISPFMGSPRLLTGDVVPKDWPDKVINKLLKMKSIEVEGK